MDGTVMAISRLEVAIMRRRSFLRATGLFTGLGLAGCLGDSTPEAANEFGYPTTTTDGIAVPLVPLADAIQWYENDVGAFADARSRTAFEQARIAGAVHSPAPDGLATDDPIAGRPKDTRVVTYCGCPHHLSTLRGATLIRNGYVHTYAIDEGFQAWRQAIHSRDSLSRTRHNRSPSPARPSPLLQVIWRGPGTIPPANAKLRQSTPAADSPSTFGSMTSHPNP